jgi:hypothetical protein
MGFIHQTAGKRYHLVPPRPGLTSVTRILAFRQPQLGITAENDTDNGKWKGEGEHMRQKEAGDLTPARRCGAKTRQGSPCKSPAMENGRCRMHGGTSTGPRTAAGLKRSRRANWKHGRYSAESLAEQRYQRLVSKYEAFLDSYGLDDISMDQFEAFDDRFLDQFEASDDWPPDQSES